MYGGGCNEVFQICGKHLKQKRKKFRENRNLLVWKKMGKEEEKETNRLERLEKFTDKIVSILVYGRIEK